ncbi:hypothetical protein 2F1_21 [Uncultured Caudovirales phage clone 2F_1]|uniref:Phage tail assembly protein n=1 Tax=Uncultured Caudovirales phage clone 2F_1 TaxID=2992576 RepID=A0A2H4J8P1_9CAUD|nr:phage tail assembly protein [Acinetobacter radioresistens]YP_010092449.1 tail protein [Uncultured Caudovirales phage clone 2F_1]ASN71622.1 hypothetical protein 2F1_21 [Uncultured Caudovirales phage clone 2F_1]RJL74419.1 phage tail assembly protein [Acinetobacter radioresistens]
MNTEVQEQNQQAIQDPDIKPVKFDVGFKRGEQFIKEITIRKPKTRALRGLTLVNLLQLDVETLAKLAPRITSPTMSENDVYELDPVDLTKLSKEVVSFFVRAEDEDFQ